MDSLRDNPSSVHLAQRRGGAEEKIRTGSRKGTKARGRQARPPFDKFSVAGGGPLCEFVRPGVFYDPQDSPQVRLARALARAHYRGADWGEKRCVSQQFRFRWAFSPPAPR